MNIHYAHSSRRQTARHSHYAHSSRPSARNNHYVHSSRLSARNNHYVHSSRPSARNNHYVHSSRPSTRNKLSPAYKTLPNGLQLVLVDLPGWHSLTNFLVIRSGSRYEDEKNNGIAHFLEHMVFKGTAKYPDKLDIAQSIEGVGGYFNAWTSNDHTAYWNTVPITAWQRGVEVPFELAFRALLRPEDLEQERGVIVEEIRRMRDDPASQVEDLLGEVLFPRHPLGLSVIGTEERIEKMTIEQFKRYRSTYYHPGQSLFICIGNIGDRNIESEVTNITSDLQPKTVTKPERFIGTSQKGLKLLEKKTDQTHFTLAMADPTFAFNQREKYVGVVLNAVLGRGMSSRLFLNIRERKGLAYAIHSSFQAFEDTGVIQIDGGVNTKKIKLTLEAIDEELISLCAKLVEPKELNKAKTMIIGSYEMSADRPIDIATWFGTSRLLGHADTLTEATAAVQAVTAQQVRDLANRVFIKDRQALAVIGPYESDKIFRDFLGN